MIDIAAVRETLAAVLAGGPIPPAHIAGTGRPFAPPAGDVPHLLVSLIWEQPPRKTGAVLWEAKGLFQAVVRVPFGVGAAAAERAGQRVAQLYLPHLDGPELPGGVRVVGVSVLGATDITDRGRTDGPARWTAVPVQIDVHIAVLVGD